MLNIARAAVIVAMLAAPAAAQNFEAANVENLRSVLSGYHEVPGPDYWQKLDANMARASLLRLSADKNELIHIRTRALSALANFVDPQVERSLIQIFNSQERGYLRAAALNTYSAIRGREAVPALEKGLSDKDEIVKISAIRGLGRVGGEQAARILQRAMHTEIDPVAKDAMARSLRSVSGR
ncbi:MAG: HEAT repeat domain-containing protein [Nitrospinota bacterium]|nr:HEAT repeat domain-containing protein [Nitrospinota bacterium]